MVAVSTTEINSNLSSTMNALASQSSSCVSFFPPQNTDIKLLAIYDISMFHVMLLLTNQGAFVGVHHIMPQFVTDVQVNI